MPANDKNHSDWDRVFVDIIIYVYRFQIDSLPAWTLARTAVLDALGCAIESQHASVGCRSLLGPNVPNTHVRNGCRLPGTTYQLDPIKCAFDLGACIRYLDHNDAIGGAEAGHPSGIWICSWVVRQRSDFQDNLGAILALCDWLSRSDSRPPTARSISPITIRTVLMALVKAYEIQGCFQLRNAFNAYGHDHTILVKLASTAVSAWILGLTEEQALTAISHVFMDGSPLRVFRNAPNTIPRKGWAAGDACSRALQLVFLARKGQPGGRTVLTAPRWGFYANLFGGQSFDLPRAYGSWVMENIFFKCVPAEGHGISAIDATLQQAQRLRTRGLNPATSIVRIRLRTHAACIRIISKRGVLCNAADRDHCVQYMIAVTLLKGRPLEVGDYTDASPWAANSEVDALRERIEVFEDAALTRDYLDPEVKTAANAVSIELRNGEVLDEVMVRHPLGHVEHPDTAKAVREKFWRNMSLRFSRQEVERILEAFEEEDTRVCDWVDLWVRNDIPRAGEIRL